VSSTATRRGNENFINWGKRGKHKRHRRRHVVRLL
jgi:hypothetical protein